MTITIPWGQRVPLVESSINRILPYTVHSLDTLKHLPRVDYIPQRIMLPDMTPLGLNRGWYPTTPMKHLVHILGTPAISMQQLWLGLAAQLAGSRLHLDREQLYLLYVIFNLSGIF